MLGVRPGLINRPNISAEKQLFRACSTPPCFELQQYHHPTVVFGKNQFSRELYRLLQESFHQNWKYSINDNTWLYEEAVIPTSDSDFPGRANPSLTTIGSNLYLGFGTGSYFENLTPDGNYAHNDMWVLNMIISGDLNGDNIINILDIVELVNVIMQNEMEYIEIADINSDSIINIFDLIHLINSI